jgi:MFS family permease
MIITTPARLKLISLCMGMMFWYGIEQLFLDTILQDPNARAWVTVVFTVTLLLFDIPGGWIADKFGRKPTLVGGLVLQAVAVALLAASDSLQLYLAGTMVFGLYWALSSGTMQAYLYDHLKETNSNHLYAKHQGGVYASGYIGAALANMASGIIADSSTLQMSYIMSLIPVAVGLLLALSLPTAHPTKSLGSRQKMVWTNRISVQRTVRSVVRALRVQPLAVFYGLHIALGAGVFMTIGEFGQIFLLTYDVSATSLGMLWAGTAIAVAVGLQLAHHVQHIPLSILAVYTFLLVWFSFAGGPLAIVLFMLVYMWSEVVHVVSETAIQHVTASRVRATVLSGVTFAGNIVAIPLIWWFNHIVQRSDIHQANTAIGITIASVIIVSLIVVLWYRQHRSKC